MVQRFNCTLKTRMWKYFTAKNTRVYLYILQDIVQGYNSSYHRRIDRAPASVSLLYVGQVRRKLYGKSWTKPRRELKFKLGDIRDKAGDLVAFEYGKVIITLHFRPSKAQYFI